MPAFSPTKFDQQIKIEIGAVERQLKETAYEAADFAMRRLALEYSPIWTGSYISSHDVNLNNAGSLGTTIKNIPGVIPPKVSLAEANSLRKQAASKVRQKIKISQMPNNGSLNIHNTSAHAMLVETLPDMYVKGTMAPYAPYLKTKLRLQAQMPAIIKKVERKYKK